MQKLDAIRLQLTRIHALTSAAACKASQLGAAHEELQALITMAEETSKETLRLTDETIGMVERLKVVRAG